MDTDYDSEPESIYEEPADDSDADADYVPDSDDGRRAGPSDSRETGEEDAEAEMDGDFECVQQLLCHPCAICASRELSMKRGCLCLSPSVDSSGRLNALMCRTTLVGNSTLERRQSLILKRR